MEAAPRLPMLCFALKQSPQETDFAKPLLEYIQAYYGENPDAYQRDVSELCELRRKSVRPTMDFIGCSTLKRYYAQLLQLENRFPIASSVSSSGRGLENAIHIGFYWEDIYANAVFNIADIRYEQACILYNIGALHSQLGSEETRQDADGMKVACTHFQCAAWAFQYLRDTYPQPKGSDMCHDLLTYFLNICLAQSQECILEKSMLDGRKSSIVAKVAAQIVEYYKLCSSLVSNNEVIQKVMDSKLCKSWKRFLDFKTHYYGAISALHMGNEAEETQKMGERQAWYELAQSRLTEAAALLKDMDREGVEEAVTFTMDVVVGKCQAAKKDNDFIYHEKVPTSLPEVKGANLVKGIPFDPSDPDIAGPELFSRLVPMDAHEASSIYSEEKAQLLRSVARRVEDRDAELAAFLSSLNLDRSMLKLGEGESLPEELIERVASLSVRPTAINDMMLAMQGLNECYSEVDQLLKTARQIYEEEQERISEHQKAFAQTGAPNNILTEIKTELSKYEEVHSKAAESNQTLQKAFQAHLSNLKLLALPLEEIQKQLPSGSLQNVSSEDKAVVSELCRLLDKVDEMRKQRAMLFQKIRDNIRDDDITKLLVTRKDKSDPAELQALFKEAMKKHESDVKILDQNLSAQENILKALLEANANFAETRHALLKENTKREAAIQSLVASFDAYEELFLKTNKGTEFYQKLRSNIQKLTNRLRSVTSVQEEERQQFIDAQARKVQQLRDGIPASGVGLGSGISSAMPGSPMLSTSGITSLTSSSGGPLKLKDYLNAMKAGEIPDIKAMGVRPTPVGSEQPALAPQCSMPQKPINVAAGQVPGNALGSGSPVNRSFPTGGTLSPYPNQMNSASPQLSPTPGYAQPQLMNNSMPFVSGNPQNLNSGFAQQNQAMPQQMPVNQYSSQISPNSALRQMPQVSQPNMGYIQQQQPTVVTQGSIISGQQNFAQSQGYMVPQYQQSQIAQTGQGVQQQSGFTQPQQFSQGQVPFNQQGSVMLAAGQQQFSQGQVSMPMQQIPTSTQSVMNSMQHIPMSAQRVSASMHQVPTSTQSVMNSMNQVPVTIQQIPTSMQQIPTPMQQVPSSMQQVPVSTQQRLMQQHIGNVPVPFGQQMQSSSVPMSSPYIPPMYSSMPCGSVATFTMRTSTFAGATTNAYSPSGYQPGQGLMYGGLVTTGVPTTTSAAAITTSAYSGDYGQLPLSGRFVQCNAKYSQPAQQYQYASSPVNPLSPTSQFQASTANNTVGLPTSGGLQNQQPMVLNGNNQSVVNGGQVAMNGGMTSQQPQFMPYPHLVQQNVPVANGNGYAPPIMAGTQQYPAASNGNYQQQPFSASNNTSLSPSEKPDPYQINDVPVPAHVPLQPVPVHSQSSSAPHDSGSAQPSAASQPISIPSSQSQPAAPADLLSGTPESSNAALSSRTVDSILQPKPLNLDELLNVSTNASQTSLQQSTLPTKDLLSDADTLARFKGDVEKLEKLVDCLTKKSLNGPTLLEQKWKDLQDMQDRESRNLAISVARCCPLKNRFPDVMPYDHNRIELKTLRDDYVNASLVKDLSPNGPSYVLTQSPLPATYGDFWCMVWEQQVETIVCLLNTNELKGHIYFPESKNEPLNFASHHLNVALQSTKTKPSYVERIIHVTNTETKTTRACVHLQLLDWPSGSSPNFQILLQFINDVHSLFRLQRNRSRPIVVHCLGGVGRSGMWCALSAAASEVAQQGTCPDVMLLASSLLRARKFALQDREQLKFLFEATLYHAQDALVKRGIISTAGGLTSATRSHKRHPSLDFVSQGSSGPVNSATQQLLDLNLGDATASSNVEPKVESLVEGSDQNSGLMQASSGDEKLVSATEVKQEADQSNPEMKSDSEHPVQQQESLNSKMSLQDLLNPESFSLQMPPSGSAGATKQKISKDSFSAGGLSVEPKEDDPFSQLDPLWSLKK